MFVSSRSYICRLAKLCSLGDEAIIKSSIKTIMSFPDFSRRFSVSLTTFVDAFIVGLLKVFTLSSFPP